MNPTASSSSDTDGIGQLAAKSPIDDLQSIAPLILDLALQEVVLAGFDGPRRLEAEEVFQFAGRLTSMTEWPEERLLEALGCTIRTLREFNGVELDGLQRCRSFLRLVTRDAGLVDTVPDRRQVVIESARLLKAIGNDVAYLGKLLETKVDGYTAIDLIRLGEVETASEKVRCLAKAASIGQTPADDDPFAETAPVHLSTTRIDMLIRDQRDALGVEVANHMKLHIKECPGCREAYAYQASHLTA